MGQLLGSSSKGHEYFLRHILGVPDAAVRGTESTPDQRPEEVRWRDEAPVGKMDLFSTIDFRMNGSCLYSDVVLPAATWYEKHDLNTTDMHPFIHAFTPAINPPWQTRTDFDAFHGIAKVFAELAGPRLGVRKDLVAAPLLHDTPDAMATPGGVVRDWKTGEVDAVPGRTMPKFIVVERDFGAVAAKLGALGPLLDRLGTTTKAVTVDVHPEIEFLKQVNGPSAGCATAGAAGHRHPVLRGDPGAVRQPKGGGHRGLHVPGTAYRAKMADLRRDGEADQLRRHQARRCRSSPARSGRREQAGPSRRSHNWNA